MPSPMSGPQPPIFVPVGNNPTRLFGLDARTRACRLATNIGLACCEQKQPGRGMILANLDFAWDRAWLKAIAAQPGHVLTLGGEPVLAHFSAGPATSLDKVDGLTPVAAETAELSYAQLRKRARPFVLRLDPTDPRPVEQAAYDAAYKGVTDALTLYLWRR